MACAGSNAAVYHATDEGGIQKLAIRYNPLRYEEDTRFAERVDRITATSAGLRRFSDVDVGDDNRVYAVAGDGVVYRFSADGEGDQQIEFDLTTLAAPTRFNRPAPPTDRARPRSSR